MQQRPCSDLEHCHSCLFYVRCTANGRRINLGRWSSSGYWLSSRIFSSNVSQNTRHLWVKCCRLVSTTSDIYMGGGESSSSIPAFSRFYLVFMIDQAELWFTILFTIDIAIRFTVWPSTSKKFFSSRKNNMDLFLVVMTLIIQIPPIHHSRAYKYMTIFQVMRIYRPIMYVEGLRLLIVSSRFIAVQCIEV